MAPPEKEDGKPVAREPPPAWLDAAFLQEAVRRGGDADAVVDAFDVCYASAVGENYCSTMFRIAARLRARPRPLSLVVKCLPEGELFRKMIQECSFFERESHMFTRVVPRMQALLDAAAPGRFPPLTARCLHHGAHPSHFIVLQDLAPLGYRMGDRYGGLDTEHAFLAVRALARFHATSHVLWRKDPSLFDVLGNLFDGKFGDEMKTNFENSFEGLSIVLQSWEDCPGNYAEKMLAIKDKCFRKIRDINMKSTGKFNVLLHGDFWVNNFLFQYDNEKLRDIKLVDLQLCHGGSPAVDLLLLRFTSLTEELCFEKWDIVLEEYHKTLTEALDLLGYDGPSLQELYKELEDNAAHSLVAAFMWLPLVKLEHGHKLDVDKAMADGANSVTYLFKSPTYKRLIKRILPLFDKQGLFDLQTYVV